MEVAPPVIAEHNGLAIDQRLVCGQAPDRLGDRREAIGEVRAAAAPNLDALAELTGQDPEAVRLPSCRLITLILLHI